MSKAGDKLWKFEWDCGRNGQLSGLFIATDVEVQSIFGEEVYFGEVLGKHSEISGMIEEREITLVTDDSYVIDVLYAECGKSVFGYNPFDYWEKESE